MSIKNDAKITFKMSYHLLHHRLYDKSIFQMLNLHLQNSLNNKFLNKLFYHQKTMRYFDFSFKRNHKLFDLFCFCKFIQVLTAKNLRDQHIFYVLLLLLLLFLDLFYLKKFFFECFRMTRQENLWQTLTSQTMTPIQK